ncbi:MAG: hemolysin family protein [Oribacterium sp.]|nr:hemolysin family protein [Oribacterium sp.]
MSQGTGELIIVLCVILSAFFSAAETAFNSLNRVKLETQSEHGDKKAAEILKLLDQYDKMLSTILIGNNLVNIGATSVATVLLVEQFGEQLGSGLSTILTTIVLLVFGEISPKSIAKNNADAFARFSVSFVRVLVFIFTPLNFVFGLWQKLLQKLFRPASEETVTDEEILSYVKEAERGGEIDRQESGLIRNSIDFNETTAEDILTPRVDMEVLDINASNEEVANAFKETNFTRIPVYKDSIDNIRGIINQKDFYSKIYGTNHTIKEIIRPVIFMIPKKPIGELLRTFQKKKMHVAIILDEYGGTVGMVTLEDIIEELVGEIWDEQEEAVEDIRRIDPKAYVVRGTVKMEDLFDAIHFKPKEEMESETVNGFLMDQLGHLPRERETVRLDHLKFTVLKTGDRRVKEARVDIFPAAEEDKEHKD